jgi:hypothetical protein
MPSNRNPRKEFRNTLNVLINCFKGAGYKMLNKKEDFWLNARNSKIVCCKDIYKY